MWFTVPGINEGKTIQEGRLMTLINCVRKTLGSVSWAEDIRWNKGIYQVMRFMPVVQTYVFDDHSKLFF